MSIRQQLEGVAHSVPGWLLLFGGLGGVAIAAGNVVSLSRAISVGRTGFDLAWPVIALIFGLGLAGYLGYLALLRARVRRERR
jgi:hypothetical protein